VGGWIVGCAHRYMKSVLQCVAVCCSVLQCVAVCCGVWMNSVSVVCCLVKRSVCSSLLQSVTVCCSLLQSVAVHRFINCVFVIIGCHFATKLCFATCCSVLWCIAVRCRVLQSVAVCCSAQRY